MMLGCGRPGAIGGRLARAGSVGLLVLMPMGGCEEPPPPPKTESASPEAEGETQKPAADPRIERAMAAARTGALPAATSQGLSPPPAGLLERQAADREVAAGAPAVLVFGDAGSVPRRLLANRATAKKTAAGGGKAASESGRLTLRARSGASLLPTLDLDWRTSLPREDSPAFQFLLETAAPSAQQPGRLPADAGETIAALSGSSVRVLLSDGLPIAPEATLKGGPALAMAFEGASHLLAHLSLGYPDQPVGTGAYWMLKSRERYLGADTVAYKMVRVSALSPTSAKLDVNIRRYLVDRSLQVEGLPEHTVVQFQAEGSATIDLPEGGVLPAQAELSERVLAMLSVASNRPGQALPFQSEVGGSWRLPVQ